MKKLFTLILFSSFCFLNSSSQTALSYYTGFDNSTEQAGWTLVRKGSTISSPWAYSVQSQLPYSGTKCLVHYYPVGEATLDWFISPAFDFSSGGKIDSVRFAFTGFSPSPTTADTIAIFLLNGNSNPDLATKTQLLDFRNTNYVSDDVWRDTGNIVIPASSGLSYIAFKYKGNTSWLDVRFDNLALSANGSAPVATFTISNETICQGDQVNFSDLSTNNPTSWSWQFPGGSPGTSTLSNPNVIYTIPGNYTVQLISSNAFGSSGPSQMTLNVNSCTGISVNGNKLSEIKVYPNPSESKFIVETDPGVLSNFTVSNLLGDEVSNGILNENGKTFIDLGPQPQGLYFLKIGNADSTEIIKIIKE